MSTGCRVLLEASRCSSSQDTEAVHLRTGKLPLYTRRGLAPVGQGATPASPATNGTVSKEAIAVAKKSQDGLHTTDGKRAYFSYTVSSALDDAVAQYNSTTDSYELFISSLGGGFVQVLLKELMGNNLDYLEGVTYDTLVSWISLAWQRYEDVLQTTYPDLSDFKAAGGKVS